KDGAACARMAAVRVFDDTDRWFTAEEPAVRLLDTLDIVLMRKDPPVDKRFVHAFYIMEHAARAGVRVVNDPLMLVDCNEKIFTIDFPQYCPPYVIGCDRAVLRDFLDRQGKIVIKPLDSMGGDGVFLVNADDVNFDVIWEIQTQR